nr:hypothetical protein [Tanacetum cinerariifolium]
KRILKKQTKTRQKTTKPNTEWKRSEKTKSFEVESQKSKPGNIKVNPRKVKVNPGNDAAPIVTNEALEMPPIGSTYEVGGPSSVTPFPLFYLHGHEIARLDDNTELLLGNVQYLEQCEKKHKTDMEASSSEIRKVKKRMDEMGQDLGDEMQFSNLVELGTMKLSIGTSVDYFTGASHSIIPVLINKKVKHAENEKN